MKKEKLLSNLSLFIDTSAETTHLTLFDDEQLIDELRWIGKGELTEALLQKIDGLLVKNNLSKNKLTSIAVFPGPGSYTGLRVGTTTANFLAWSLKIAIAEAVIEDKKLLAKKSKGYILPLYLSDPHITKPKKTT